MSSTENEKQLDDETSCILREVDLHDIHDCWEDEYTPDADCLGHAEAEIEFSGAASIPRFTYGAS